MKFRNKDGSKPTIILANTNNQKTHSKRELFHFVPDDEFEDKNTVRRLNDSEEQTGFDGKEGNSSMDQTYAKRYYDRVIFGMVSDYILRLLDALIESKLVMLKKRKNGGF